MLWSPFWRQQRLFSQWEHFWPHVALGRLVSQPLPHSNRSEMPRSESFAVEIAQPLFISVEARAHSFLIPRLVRPSCELSMTGARLLCAEPAPCITHGLHSQGHTTAPWKYGRNNAGV